MDLLTILPRAVRHTRRAGLLAVLVALLQPGEIRANVFVQCGVDPAALPSGTYSTLNAALSALSLEGPHTITVTGTCQENVQLQSCERLTIQGPEGGTATIINAADPPFWVFAVGRSRQIRLSRLIVSGGSIGIRIDSASSIDIIDCIAENNGLGVLADENSTLRMNRHTSRNNQGHGVLVSRGSHVSFSLGMPEPPPFVRIHDNGGAGININSGTVTISGPATVENNVGAAIVVAAGRLQMSGGQGEAGNIIRMNGFGINASGNSSVRISGNNLVQTNGSGGIQVGGSSLDISSGQGPDGTPLFTTVEGHGALGINVALGSNATVAGPHRIHNNGFDFSQPEFTGGIRVARSNLHLTGAVEVTGNNGAGIIADLNATISTSPGGSQPQITGNAAEGMRMTRLSAAAFALPPVISGNGGVAISCDRSSWLFGDTSGINDVKCSNTDKGK